MINKINKIKNLGLVFANYTWDTSLPEFKKFNLVYGWNGSGKTTLSRLFSAIGGVPIEDLQYEVVDDRGTSYAQGAAFPKKIRVFNQDYILNNIQILEGKTKTILIVLGEENKQLAEQIEKDNILLSGDSSSPGRISLKNENEKKRERKSKERDSKFTEIAKTIGAAIGGNALRNYRKPQAEKDFSQITAKAELSDDELEKYLSALKEDSEPEISPLVLQKIKHEAAGTESELTDLLKMVILEATTLLQKTVVSEVIPRLAAHADIAQWVEQGQHLHSKHSSKVCEYCQQSISQKRIEELARHFNEADKKLKISLDDLIDKLQRIYQLYDQLTIPDKTRFYTALQAKQEAISESYVLAKMQLLEKMKELAEELKGKKAKTTEAVALIAKLDVDEYHAQVVAVNGLIAEHNNTTKEHEKVKSEAMQKLKTHYLGTIYDEVKKLNNEIAQIEETIKSLGEEISETQKRISGSMAKISNHHKTCEELNKKLAAFLGHQELIFTPHIEKEHVEGGGEIEVITGYNIMRGNQLAYSLSEGEKTAIAFVYFLVHLGDQEFNIKDGVVVIDDPISSLDSNSQYQAFSFLKNAIHECRQVFVFTHNYDFMKLVINWRRRAGGAGYYMLKSKYHGNIRAASIHKMDKELCQYESEYHYLYKVLKQCRADQDGTIAMAYPVPNIARKVWEYYLSFCVPNGKDAYSKMKILIAEGYDSQKMDAIYKYTNDLSHISGGGFNPSLVPEAVKAIEAIFELMEKITPRHYRHLEEATN